MAGGKVIVRSDFSTYWEYFISTMTEQGYYEEITQAKRDFIGITGDIPESNYHYEMKMKAFMDYYLFDRMISSAGPTQTSTLDHFLHHHLNGIPTTDRTIFRHFKNHIHSLFLVKKQSGGFLYLKDLYSNKSFQCANIRESFEKGQIVQSRLIPFEDVYGTSGAYTLHPKETLPFIKKVFKTLRKEQYPLGKLKDVLFKLAYCYAKSQQYQHITPAKIYENQLQLNT